MKIKDLRSERNGAKARVAATVIWEDCDRPSHEVYFETDEAFAEDLSCNPHAFLVGCIIPALHFGEKRLSVEGAICPQLSEGLVTVMGWLRHWYYKAEREAVRIEAKAKRAIPAVRKPERAGFFFSGGVDSFATLRTNRLDFPPGHPRSIRDGILVFGLEVHEPDAFEHVIRPLSEAAREAGVTLIPVYTNLYLNYKQEDAKQGYDFWTYEFHGAVLAAVAHALDGRLTVVSIPATQDIPTAGLLGRKEFIPYGSHPLLDPNYSSGTLKIRHDGFVLSRLDKVRLVAGWEPALMNLRVCNRQQEYRSDMLNCGRCEKCLRTMLELKLLGALERTKAFPEVDLMEGYRKLPELRPYYYPELLVVLRERGHGDLARLIESKIAAFSRRRKIGQWKARMKQVDSAVLNRSLIRFKRLLFPQSAEEVKG